ncbi:centromere protein U [Cynoglossus semilaevis]|uniref:Centromere protein U n=1 Tax=Cynoglossus semilaevis TaxID=244447 RepID=A0A3P8WY52_CYNSE|nr:centromere protein U [Cynoglossus semilaevis]
MSHQTAVCFGEDSNNLSAIEKASFLEGLQQNTENRLHSTAIEEELTVVKTKLPVAATKRKNRDNDPGNTKRARPAPQQKVKARTERRGVKGQKTNSDRSGVKADANSVLPTSLRPRSSGVRVLARKNTAQSTSTGSPNSVRANRKSVKMKKSQSEAQVQLSPQQESDGEQQSRRSALSSSEAEDEDTSWKPLPEKAKVQSFGRGGKTWSVSPKSRKSSSGGGRDQEQTATSAGTGRSRRRTGPPGTDLELVLEAFLHLCDQFRESAESKSIKDLIDLFSSNVEEQLMEKIMLFKDLKVLKRENTKVASLIRSKTHRLLEAKNELMRQERRVLLLQKEKSELTLKLSDLRRSHHFLCDLRQLSQQHVDQQHVDQQHVDQQHSDQQHVDQQQLEETYGASSLAALVLEAKHVQTTEQQLRSINQRMEKRLEHSRDRKQV